MSAVKNLKVQCEKCGYHHQIDDQKEGFEHQIRCPIQTELRARQLKERHSFSICPSCRTDFEISGDADAETPCPTCGRLANASIVRKAGGVPAGFEIVHEEWLKQGGNVYADRDEDSLDGYYSTRYWRRVKEILLSEADRRCYRCWGTAKYVHHLSYEFVGEDHLHPEYLVAVCRACHMLVEYARIAETLTSRIRRRIVGCQMYINGCPLAQPPTVTCSSLLEYQDQLRLLRQFYEGGIPFGWSPFCWKGLRKRLAKERRLLLGDTSGQQRLSIGEARGVTLSEKRLAGERETRARSRGLRAKGIVESWSGTEVEKAVRMVLLLKDEIANYKAFAASVLAPVRQGSVVRQLQLKLP
jgi:predicted RNA-binding Zn-ribbon protein involved in translation (DUF1610 family)